MIRDPMLLLLFFISHYFNSILSNPCIFTACFFIHIFFYFMLLDLFVFTCMFSSYLEIYDLCMCSHLDIYHLCMNSISNHVIHTCTIFTSIFYFNLLIHHGWYIALMNSLHHPHFIYEHDFLFPKCDHSSPAL